MANPMYQQVAALREEIEPGSSSLDSNCRPHLSCVTASVCPGTPSVTAGYTVRPRPLDTRESLIIWRPRF